jgi:hypothetical protein
LKEFLRTSAVLKKTSGIFNQSFISPHDVKEKKKFEKEPYKCFIKISLYILQTFRMCILDNLDVKLIIELSRLSLKLSDLQANG